MSGMANDTGGSSISGPFVSCFTSMENCLEACYMSCFVTDHCNDSAEGMVACAPDISMIVFTTVLFVLFVCCICCAIPLCICAWCCKKCCFSGRNRASTERSQPPGTYSPYPSAPLLPPKANIP